jgi:hypothetical protein
VAAYAVTVLAFDRLVAAGSVPIDWLASSPAGLVHGRVWTMVSSGLVTAGGRHLMQTALLVAVLLLLAARHGGWLATRTALAAHVGSALVAYAGLWLVTGTGLANDDVDLIAPDYGTSCIWFGCLAGLVAAELLRYRRQRFAMALVLSGGAVLVAATTPVVPDPLTTAEHLLAMAIGAGCAIGGRLRRQSAPSPVLQPA